MNKLKEFLDTPFGKKVEKYLWEVLVLTIGLLTAYGAEINAGWVIAITPVLFQITKYININYLK